MGHTGVQNTLLLLSLGSNSDSGVGDDLGGLAELQGSLHFLSVDQLLNLLDLQLVLLGQSLELGIQILVGDLDTLGLSDLLQSQVDLSLLLSGGTESVAHGGNIAAHHLGVLLHGVAAHLQLVCEVIHLVVQLGLDQSGGHVNGDVLGSLLNGSVLESGVDLLLSGLQGIGANFIPKNLNQEIYNDVYTVTEEDAYTAARNLARLSERDFKLVELLIERMTNEK